MPGPSGGLPNAWIRKVETGEASGGGQSSYFAHVYVGGDYEGLYIKFYDTEGSEVYRIPYGTSDTVFTFWGVLPENDYSFIVRLETIYGQIVDSRFATV